MIASTLGPGHAAVTVSADLDMSKSTDQGHDVHEHGAGHAAADPAQDENKHDETLTEPAAGGTNGVLGVGNNGANATAAAANRNFSESTTTQRQRGRTRSRSPPTTRRAS